MTESLLDRLAGSGFSGGSAAFIEDLYEKYLLNPESVSEDWQRRFAELPQVNGGGADTAHGPVRESFARLARQGPRLSSPTQLSTAGAEKQAAVLRLINAHRVRGHQAATLDPLQLRPRTPVQDLELGFHGLSDADLDTVFHTGSLFAADRMALRDILDLVRDVYTRTVGSEYMHITDTQEKRWIQQRLETYRARPELGSHDQRWLLQTLTAAEGLEKYLHSRYVGQKRFSLEGGESLIPMLDELVQRAGRDGAREIVLGMAHRGRLNVLVNIWGKSPALLFDEFEGRGGKALAGSPMTSGDVKYHMGFSNDVRTPGGIVHLAMGFNPSHLEIIGPVIEGSVRARQQRRYDKQGNQVLPVVIHGDSAFAGQGVVMETFNLYMARGYATGGTVHIVINNQIGFTTSNPLDTRSTFYCTDVAKMVQAPIFHVNGDDPEAVVFVTRLALDYRNRFHKDVVIDLVCYRRHGHNEADEPAVTQPMMYQKIRQRETTRACYAEHLVHEGAIAKGDAQQMVTDYRDGLDRGELVGRPPVQGESPANPVDWTHYNGIRWDHNTTTAVDPDRLKQAATGLTAIPEDFKLHPRVKRIFDDRRKMAAGDQLLDWGFAENLAYATLLYDGYPIRISGQDCRRGTFFHRHAMVRDQDSGRSHMPLANLYEDQPHIVVIDSVLSEEAVLAFEYGYAITEPDTLVIWEGQFGDFANGAQVVIDQFISSAGSKWGLHCGLVMLLPHGFEGQGPEHSSARLERYMQLCAEHNMQVCVPSTPAQIFHLLRRQMVRPYRRPLVVMSPKSLLRHPLATSPLSQLSNGRFEPVLGEVDALDKDNVSQVILCSGKIYYELLESRRSRGIDHVAIVRMEQLYPFPEADFNDMLTRYPNARTFVWCQEEPQNQGAWDMIKHRFHALNQDDRKLYFVGRKVAAAPATGVHKRHVEEQELLIDEALSARFNPTQNKRIIP